ncbi:MAG: NAD(P)/FAD-dependent oxidoreductase [Mesorhizobium sp.]|nr:MAG: NAD(P)/FAD-dependent oxidoreductase [Mesorhizobium sp.]RWD85795.1 MAG: NAD(P)/FAD-dependent oxidoreductase [Mesorhizobium sp.]RWE54933.1 MAG: NAD(P)/FAD-dependent oxidoreductase [Mesorhizobium sp.]TIS40090.1 MAG: NAD(P)/FAD-dependent oxidoreductase [Mesorhizobium sp.]
MYTMCDVTIVGAGPYGLSVAAHLRGLGIECRIIGSPMESWKSKMPKGMLLKSAGFASNLSDPERAFTLREFCIEHGSPYDHLDLPIPLETFSAYGLAFQKRCVPGVEDEELVSLVPAPEGFDLRMKSGLSFRTRKVVIATGLTYFRHIPELLSRLPSEKLSHAADVHDLQRFRGQRVAVLGGGASAIDIAALLNEAQVDVQHISRKPAIIYSGRWGGSGSHPTLRRLVRPVSGIGPGWKHRLFADWPWLFRYFPESYRLEMAAKFPSPSGGEPMKNRAATVPLLVGRSPQEVRLSEHGVQLKLLSMDGNTQVVEADHVIAATGYKADVRRFPFLSSSIVEQLRLVGKTPKLSPNFESSIPGLYFVGQVSTTTFGPVMRFVFGTEFTSRMISRHLARMQPRSWREFPRRIAGQHQPTADIFSPEMPVDVHLEPTKRSQSSR